MDRQFFVYIMASKPGGTLYTGVTSDIQARVYQHKNGLFEGFTKKYGVKLLVYFEEHGTALGAIHREKRIKKWPRDWKINLIRASNPEWRDLAAGWYSEMPTAEEIESWFARIANLKDGELPDDRVDRPHKAGDDELG